MSEIGDETLTAFLSVFRPPPHGLHSDALRDRMGLSAGDLQELVARLEVDGFSFRTDEDGRLVLEDAPDRLWPYWIRAGLRCDRLGTQIYYEEEVESTQDIAFELMVEGRPHGTLVLADHQTEGRGRGDNSWRSTPGKGLQFSLLLDLEPPDTFASVLTIATATAITRAIHDVAGLPARIRFPNDIVVRGRKVAGILLEVRDYGVPTRRAVAGVGINVNQLRSDLPEALREKATTLREETPDKEEIRRTRLLRYILRELERWLDRIAQDDFGELEQAWNHFAPMTGRDVSIRKGNEEIEGRVIEARLRAGLLLRLPDGQQRRLRLEHIGELRLKEE